MKIRMIFLITLLACSSVVFGQTDDSKWLSKLKKKLPKNELFKSIEANKAETEKLVTRLKYSKKVNKDLIDKYNKVQKAYDKVFDAMMEDVNNANTIGGLVEELIESKKRSEHYDVLGKEAGVLYQEFQKAGLEALEDKKGWIKDLVDWGIAFLPGTVKKISDASLATVKVIITTYIDSARFQDWDDI